MTLFDLIAKLTLDTSEFERGVKSSSDGAKGLGDALKIPANASETLKNKISVLGEQYKSAQKNVEQLTTEFNKSVRETGATSEKSQELARKLADAEKEADSLGKELKELQKETDGAGDRFSKFGGKLKSVLGMAVKAAAGAAAAGAAAIGAIVKQSVEAYANYEQLVGGAAKIFDEIDQSKILEDAGNAWKNLNMSANEYLAAINQTGAMFAQTMGDEKGYETAKRGMQAISDYATGTGRDINELNEKFGMITRSTSSYQSIADQFAGILPATSKEFLRQAQAAGFLSDEYTELTQVPVAEYQEAVSKMLEKGTKELGFAGNTAKESLTTISGALAATKAAWENLLTGLADPDADLSALIDNLVIALVGENEGEGLLNQLTPAIEHAVEGLVTVIQEVGPILAEQFGPLMELILPPLITAIASLLAAIAAKLPGMLIELLGHAIESLILALVAWSEKFINAGMEWIAKLGEGVQNGFKTLWTNVTTWAKTVVEKIKSGIGSLVSMGSEKIKGLQDGIKAAFTVLWTNITEWAKKLPQNIKSGIGSLVSMGSEKIRGLMNGIKTAFSTLWSNALSWAQKVPQKIKSGLGSLWSIGSDLIAGLWNGIKAKFDAVVERVKELASRLPRAVKKVLGIESPSKVFAEVGKWIPAGLAVGIEKNLGVVESAADAMADATEITPTNYEFGGGKGRWGKEGETDDEREDRIVSVLNVLLELLQRYIPDLSQRQLVLDTGALVGGLAYEMDNELGVIYDRRKRGM